MPRFRNRKLSWICLKLTNCLTAWKLPRTRLHKSLPRRHPFSSTNLHWPNGHPSKFPATSRISKQARTASFRRRSAPKYSASLIYQRIVNTRNKPFKILNRPRQKNYRITSNKYAAKQNASAILAHQRIRPFINAIWEQLLSWA